jgi:hypothetical protein
MHVCEQLPLQVLLASTATVFKHTINQLGTCGPYGLVACVIGAADAPNVSDLQTSMRQQDFQASHWQSMTLLWRQQLLCDVQLRASSGELLSAHSVVLASSSGFFRCGPCCSPQVAATATMGCVGQTCCCHLVALLGGPRSGHPMHLQRCTPGPKTGPA